METTLYIEGTAYTPEIDFNVTEVKFTIKGRSMPENTEKFYNPILDWLRVNLHDGLDTGHKHAIEERNDLAERSHFFRRMDRETRSEPALSFEEPRVLRPAAPGVLCVLGFWERIFWI